MTRVSSRILGNILGLHAGSCENRVREESFVSLCLLCRDNRVVNITPTLLPFQDLLSVVKMDLVSEGGISV